MPYPNYINFIAANEKVVPNVVNRPTRELSLRTEALKERLDTSELGQAVILYDAPLSTDTVIGSPVYWNESSRQFELAVAEAEFSKEYMEFLKTERANCIGLVYKKESKNSGHIVLSGVVDLTGISTLFNEPGSGRFFLDAIPGKLTHKILGICIPIGTVIGRYGDCDDTYRVCVNPVLNDLWSHLHYQIDLVPKLVFNKLEEGWRFIDETDTDAPADAVYRYNIIPGTTLANLFPPVPVDACSIEVDWNDLDESIGSKNVPINCDNGIARVTVDGIFWTDSSIKPYAPSSTFELVFTGKNSLATWSAGDKITIGSYEATLPLGITTDAQVAAYIVDDCGGHIDGWSLSVETNPAEHNNILLFSIATYAEPLATDTTNTTKIVGVRKDPRIMREKLYMSKTQFANGLNCVTSLRPYSNHPFKFVNCRGVEAYAGDLYAKFTLADIEKDIDIYDGSTMRRFNSDYEQEITPVVNAISVAGTTINAVSNVEPIVINGKTYYRGLTDITVDPLNNAEISPQIMKLGDALEREYNGVMYVGFPRDRESSILAKFEVPGTFNGSILFSTLFYSSIAGEYPSITCEYKVISKPDISVSLNGMGWNVLEWDTGTGTTVRTVQANTAFNLTTNLIANIKAGDTVILRVVRNTTGASYAGDAGIIRINGVLRT